MFQKVKKYFFNRQVNPLTKLVRQGSVLPPSAIIQKIKSFQKNTPRFVSIAVAFIPALLPAGLALAACLDCQQESQAEDPGSSAPSEIQPNNTILPKS